MKERIFAYGSEEKRLVNLARLQGYFMSFETAHKVLTSYHESKNEKLPLPQSDDDALAIILEYTGSYIN